MSVLSDSEIQRRIAQGELVPGGNPAMATECSYAFVPGCAFLAGGVEAPIDFPGADGKAVVLTPRHSRKEALVRRASPTLALSDSSRVAKAHDQTAPFYDHWKWQTFWRATESPIIVDYLDRLYRDLPRAGRLLDVD